MLATAIPSAALPKLRTAGRLGRLLRTAERARVANPRVAGFYAGPLTITDNLGIVPGQISTAVPYALSDANRGVWHVVGGRMVRPGLNNIVAAMQDGSGTGYASTYGRYEAMVHSRYLCVRVSNATVPYRFLVDGQYVSLAGTTPGTPASGTSNYLLLDFGARAIRRVAIEVQTNGTSLGAAYVEATGKMWPVDLSDAVHAVWLGDSYVGGANAVAKGDGAAVQMADRLGLHLHASGVGGTGWNHPNQAVYRFDQRIAAGDLGLSYHAPEVVFLMASYNDRNNGDMSVVRANAATGLAAARAQYPGVPIVVFGAAPGNSGPSSGIVGAETAVAAAVATLADPLTAFVPVSTDPLGAWITGTGKAGTTTGTGNSDYLTDSDGVHPVDAEGVGHLGRRYAVGALAALTTMARSV